MDQFGVAGQFFIGLKREALNNFPSAYFIAFNFYRFINSLINNDYFIFS